MSDRAADSVASSTAGSKRRYRARLGCLARALLAGVLGGGVALVVDLVLVRLMTASATPLPWRLALPYGLVGGMLGAVLGGVGQLFGKRRLPRALPVAAASFALLYALPIGGRIERQQAPGGWIQVGVPLVLGVGGYLGLVVVLTVLARADRSSVGATVVGPTLGGACAALGLSANRFLIERAFEPSALLADGAIVAVVIGLGLIARRWGALRVLGGVGAVLVVAAAVAAFRHDPLPHQAAGGSTAIKPPHLLLVVIDTLREDVFADVLGSTPEGARLRRALGGAAYFPQTISASSWTAPSMGSLFTGLYPQEHGFVSSARDRRDWAYRRLAPSATTLAQRLARHGYWCEGIGTNPILPSATGIDRGLDEYRLLSGPTVRLPLLTTLTRMGAIEPDYYQPADAVVRRFSSRVDAVVASGRPAFFWLHLMDTHHPLHRRPTFAEDIEAVGTNRELHARYRSEARYALDRASAMIERFDQAIGGDQALVVLVADHGEMLPEDRPGARRTPPVYGHGHVLYDPVVRVPLVIRPPGGLEQPRELDQLVHQVDLHDTVLDLLGLDAQRIGKDRRSLAPWLRHSGAPSDAQPRTWALLSHNHHGPPQRALRTVRYKLITWPGGERGPELYDLLRDPLEVDNVASREPQLTDALRAQLEERFAALETAADSGNVPLDPQTRRQLEALGYTTR